MTDTLQTLLERLQNAEGPDREIDALIECAFSDRDMIIHKDLPSGFVMKDTGSESGNRNRAQSQFISKWREPSNRYTASLDASIELVEKVISILPKCGFRIYSEWEGPGYALIHWGDPRDQKIKTAYAKTLPLALLTALVRALIAEQE